MEPKSPDAPDTPSSTSNGSETSSDPNSVDQPTPEEEATTLLCKRLQQLVEEDLGPWLNDFQLRLEPTEAASQDDETIWSFGFETSYSSEKKQLEGNMTADDGQGPSKAEFFFRVDKQDGQIVFALKTPKSRKWKNFPICRVDKVDEEFALSKDEAKLEYTGKNPDPSILKVWFPQEKTKTALRVPVELIIENGVGETLRENGWAEHDGESVLVSLPDVNFDTNKRDLEVKDELKKKWCRVAVVTIVYWTLANVHGGGSVFRGSVSMDDKPTPFPKLTRYRATRPVDLHPANVTDELEEEDLFFPWHVIESACSALNAGKHVIFSGPPGCGKSKLAKFLAEKATGRAPIISTASPAWTVGDVVGRYHPKNDGHGLEFREGHFLRALKGDVCWLIIDEFNRADIDACFGELFSVLAGDPVETPYQKRVRVETDQQDEDWENQSVRILPGQKESDADYRVADEFRIIGTMNDADRSGLNTLSFALMRRFAIIPVDPPNEKKIQNKIIVPEIRETNERLELKDNAWKVTSHTACDLSNIEDELQRLFANTEDSKEDSFRDLIAESVVGVSVAKDVVRFVGEGLRSGVGNRKIDYSEEALSVSPSTRGGPAWAKNLTLSYLALAIVLQVYPQLEALAMGTTQEENQLLAAVRHIFWALNIDKKDLMLRISSSENGGYEMGSDETIAEFLFRNLEKRFPHQAPGWREELAKDYPVLSK